MSRDIAAATLTAITGEVVTRAVAVEITFDSAPVRATSAPFTITLDGDDYLGVGELGTISGIDETGEIQSTQITLSLTGIPRDQIDTVMAEPTQNRAVVVYEVALNPSTMAVIGDPIAVFRGRIDTIDITLGDTATVALTVTNRLADWERPANSLYSDEEQQRRHTGDLAFEYAAALEGKQIPFPAKSFFEKNPGW